MSQETSHEMRHPEQPAPQEPRQASDDEAVPDELLEAETAAYGEREATAVAAEIARGVALAREARSADATDEEAVKTQRMGRLTRFAARRTTDDAET